MKTFDFKKKYKRGDLQNNLKTIHKTYGSSFMIRIDKKR